MYRFITLSGDPIFVINLAMEIEQIQPQNSGQKSFFPELCPMLSQRLTFSSRGSFPLSSEHEMGDVSSSVEFPKTGKNSYSSVFLGISKVGEAHSEEQFSSRIPISTNVAMS
jgi:hypothetical protein